MLSRLAYCSHVSAHALQMGPLLVNSTNTGRRCFQGFPKRLCQTATKDAKASKQKRSEIWNLISLAKPERYRLACKYFDDKVLLKKLLYPFSL